LRQYKKLHPAIRSLLLRELFDGQFGINLNEETLENIDSLTKKKGRYRAVLPQDVTASLEYDAMKFAKTPPFQRKLKSISIQIPFYNMLSEWNIELEMRVLSIKELYAQISKARKPSFGKIWKNAATGIKPFSMTEYLDAEAVGVKQLVIRSKKSGDRYHALGKSGSRLLKKLFIDEKVPISIRERIPVFTARGKIIYVAGHRIADSVKITEKTRKVLKLKLTIFPL
jgi:tRNA(Ile)-lysidine synthetase-like protein